MKRFIACKPCNMSRDCEHVKQQEEFFKELDKQDPHHETSAGQTNWVLIERPGILFRECDCGCEDSE